MVEAMTVVEAKEDCRCKLDDRDSNADAKTKATCWYERQWSVKRLSRSRVWQGGRGLEE